MPLFRRLGAPVTHLVATATASATGVQFRTLSTSETLGTSRCILFDKIGTLTEGKPRVRNGETRPGISRVSALAPAATTERDVAHPVAQALREAGGDGMTATTARRFGVGVVADIGGQAILLGNRGFMATYGVVVPPVYADQENTQVFLAIDGIWAASVHLGDALLPDAAATLAHLCAQGIEISMVRRYAVAVCARVGAAVGLHPREIHATCSHEGKAALVTTDSRQTAFVGDRVNDLPAIVGTATGVAASSASSATMALAYVVAARGSLAAVTHALAVSRRARRVLRQNLAFSVIYNMLELGLAVYGTVPPVAAAGAMVAISPMPRAWGGASHRTGPAAAVSPDSSRKDIPCLT